MINDYKDIKECIYKEGHYSFSLTEPILLDSFQDTYKT